MIWRAVEELIAGHWSSGLVVHKMSWTTCMAVISRVTDSSRARPVLYSLGVGSWRLVLISQSTILYPLLTQYLIEQAPS